jgi:CheY-like chemotaxis protein
MSLLSPSVLIVDDEPLIRAYARDIVEEAGYAATEAKNATEALHVLAEVRVDVVVTDIELGGGPNGLELTEVIRQKWPKIALVVMSGQVLPPTGTLPDGAAFVTKPFSDQRLLSVLTSVRHTP